MDGDMDLDLMQFCGGERRFAHPFGVGGHTYPVALSDRYFISNKMAAQLSRLDDLRLFIPADAGMDGCFTFSGGEGFFSPVVP